MVVPLPLSVPLVNVVAPVTVKVPVPVSVPDACVRLAALGFAASRFNVPPVIFTDPRPVTVPCRSAVPPLTVVLSAL
jgi:hypothetical protein